MSQSVVQEYSCQYTDQVKKKHKTWQDGKLKYFSANNKFILYSDPDATMLSSGYITNSKDLRIVLDPAGFGHSEHKIFGRYVVIIEDLVSEYCKEETNVVQQNKVLTVEKRQYKPLTKPIANIPGPPNGFSASLLTLKCNKQYIKPKTLRKGKVLHDKNKMKTQIAEPRAKEVAIEVTKSFSEPKEVMKPKIQNSNIEKPDSLRRPRNIARNNHKIEHKPINIL